MKGMPDSLIPKYVDELLKRRSRLSRKLRVACCELDDYCARIGVDFDDPDACLMSDVRIFCEEDAAESSTRAVIERTLRKNADLKKLKQSRGIEQVILRTYRKDSEKKC